MSKLSAEICRFEIDDFYRYPFFCLDNTIECSTSMVIVFIILLCQIRLLSLQTVRYSIRPWLKNLVKKVGVCWHVGKSSGKSIKINETHENWYLVRLSVNSKKSYFDDLGKKDPNVGMIDYFFCCRGRWCRWLWFCSKQIQRSLKRYRSCIFFTK